MPCNIELEREARIIMQIMLKKKHVIKKLPMNEMALYRDRAGSLTFLRKLPTLLVNYMKNNKWLKLNEGLFSYTETGREWVSSFLYFIELKMHDETEFEGANDNKKNRSASLDLASMNVHDAELEHSPILKLYNRQRNITHKYLNMVHLQAGNELYKQFMVANLQPKLTRDWQSVRQTHYMGTQETGFSERAYMARKQLYECLESVGSEFSAILVEICLFGKGLEATEKAQNWPARSGKLMLTMALDKLAVYFGMAQLHDNKNQYLDWLKVELPNK